MRPAYNRVGARGRHRERRGARLRIPCKSSDSLENAWKILGKVWITLGFTLEINFDFLVRIEPFQGLARTPGAIFSLCPDSPVWAPPRARPTVVQSNMATSLNS